MKQFLIYIIFILITFQVKAQEPNDCVNAITVCGNGVFSSNATGIGTTQEISGCGGQESNSLWLKINIVQSGTLGFNLIPDDPSILVDYDFWVFGPNRLCSNLGNPIRCATTNPNEAGLASNHTGINGSTTLTQTGPGSNGNGYVYWLNVTAGQSYYLAIDRPEGEGGFQIQWTGTATQGTGAFPTPPEANAIEDVKQCSSNPNVSIFDLNSLKNSINSDLGNTIEFYQNLADAIDDINELPSIYANSSNPQTIYAKVKTSLTDCYTIVDFDLVVTPIPTATVSVSNTLICSGDDVIFTITGTPNTTINYSIDGGTIQNILLDATGVNTITQTPTSSITFELVNAQLLSGSGIVICSQSLSDSETVNVISNTFPTIISNSPVCENEDGILQFSGDPNATITYNIDNGTNLTFNLDATGVFTLVIPDLSATTNVTIVSVTSTAAPNCLLSINTIETIVVNPSPTVIAPNPLLVCNDSTNPNSAVFNLDAESAFISNNEPNVVVTYYETQLQAETGNAADALVSPYNSTSANQIIYVRVENNLGCIGFTTLNLQIIGDPIANVVAPLRDCDTNNQGNGVFDLTQVITDITAGNTQTVQVSFYLLQSEAEAGMPELTNSTTFQNTIPFNQTIYVRVDSDSTDCFSIVPLDLEVYNTPILIPLQAFEICDDTSNDGIAQFDLETKTALLLGGTTNISVTYHTSQAAAEDGTNPLTSPFTNTSNPQTIYIRAENDFYTACIENTTFNLVVNPLPTIVAPTLLEVCDDGVPDGLTSIDLSIKDTEITANTPNYLVSYHSTQSEADNGINALPIPYTNTSNPQVVFVRVQNIDTTCYSTTTLTLAVEQAPIANTPMPIEYCDADSDGFGIFILTDANNEITGGDVTLTVSYHESIIDAQNNENALTSPYSNTIENQQIIYVRIESSTIATDCASFTELILNVNPSPQIVNPTPLKECDDLSADGFAQFDLSSKVAEILNGLNPVQYDVTYYQTEANAIAGTNPITNTSNYTNTLAFSQLIWVRINNNTTNCYTLTTLELIVNVLPVVSQPMPIMLCDENNPGDEKEVFFLDAITNEIVNGQSDISLKFFTNQTDANNNTNPISSPYTNIVNPQTIYIAATNDVTGCRVSTTATLLLQVNPIPEPTAPADLIVCDENNDGFASFNLEDRTLEIIGNQLNLEISYYENLSDAETSINAITSPYINTVSPQLIYVRATDNSTGCFTLVDLTLVVNPIPNAVTVSNFSVCEVNNDGVYDFDLTSKDTEVLNGQDSLLFTVTYHESQQDADGLVNALISPYSNLSNPQQIFVAITNNTSGCSVSTSSFILQVQEAAVANSGMEEIIFEVCNNEIDDDNNPSNNSEPFDLTTQDSAILDGQNPANYSVTYYISQADAEQGINPLPSPYDNEINPQVIWARVDNDTTNGSGSDSSNCYALTTLTLKVNPLPAFDLADSYVICFDNNGSDIFPVLDTGLSTPMYNFTWFLNANEILGANEGSYVPTEGGTYSVTVTDLTSSSNTMCESSTSTLVIESNSPVVTATVITEEFAANQIIEVNAVGIGNYEYSLDYGPWQDENIFTNVPMGVHSINVKDKNGCGETNVQIMVIDYPKFFTPNGDGYQDTWNISFPDVSQINATIYIFDRYGKLLKELRPESTGWNGSYNENQLPTSDYWFVVEYNDPNDLGTRKEFKAHFTLKR